MHERRYTDSAVYKRVLREAKPYWAHIVVIFCLSLLSAPMGLLMPLPLKIAVDNVISKQPVPESLAWIIPSSLQATPFGLLAFAVILLIVLELLSQLRSLLTSLLTIYTTERLTLQGRSQLFSHAQRLSLAHHDRMGTTDSIYRIMYDVPAVPSIAVDGVIPFISSGITFISMIIVIAWLEPTLALLAILVTPIIVGLTYWYRSRLRARHREVKKLQSSAMSIVQEVLSLLRVVKIFGQESREERRFAIRAIEGMRAKIMVTLVDGSFWVAISLVTALGTGCILFFGVRSVEAGVITLGSLLVIMAYLAQLYSPLYSISRQVASLQSNFASAERVFTLLDESPDVPERLDARPLILAKGLIEFVDVGFAYETARPILQHASFRVDPGTRVGIMGRTGAGKTTILSLLTRFYDPTEGAIFLDGIDLRDYRLKDLRSQFAVVLQEPVLFSTTIRENIEYGKPESSMDEIVAAAEAAGIHDFITTLPSGYDTPVGERGMSLSGGERQRISLARAFLKDSPILILDEPTSSVDTKTESIIIDAMERLMAGRTTFMVAHRLSTLESCSLRLRVEDGRVFIAEGLDIKALEAISA
jgi:ATP-binding cassette subfamily B protein